MISLKISYNDLKGLKRANGQAMIIYAILLFLGFLIGTTSHSNDLISLFLLCSVILIPIIQCFKWIARFVHPYIERHVNKKQAIAKKRRDLIIHIITWLENPEQSSPGLLHFLETKVNSQEFQVWKDYLNRKEKIRINEIYRKAQLNPTQPVRNTFYYPTNPENHIPELADEFIHVIANSVMRLQKKWKLI